MPQHMIQVPCVEQEWLYVPDAPYETVNGVTRCLQLIIPHRRAWPEGLRVPVVALVPGSAWYRQGHLVERPHSGYRGSVSAQPSGAVNLTARSAAPRSYPLPAAAAPGSPSHASHPWRHGDR